MKAAALRLATAARLRGGADCTCKAPPGTPVRCHAIRCALRRGGTR